MNSIRVAGGAPPDPHWRLPQSPVLQDVPASLQKDLAQILPDQEACALRALEVWEARAKPEDEMAGPLLVSVAGQMV